MQKVFRFFFLPLAKQLKMLQTSIALKFNKTSRSIDRKTQNKHRKSTKSKKKKMPYMNSLNRPNDSKTVFSPKKYKFWLFLMMFLVSANRKKKRQEKKIVLKKQKGNVEKQSNKHRKNYENCKYFVLGCVVSLQVSLVVRTAFNTNSIFSQVPIEFREKPTAPQNIIFLLSFCFKENNFFSVFFILNSDTRRNLEDI